MIGLLAVLLAAAPGAACHSVTEDTETVSITGVMEERDGWVALRPDPPVCIELDGTPTPYDASRRYDTVDIFFSGGRNRFPLRFGERVRVSGRLAGAHSEEHHADLLIVVREPGDIRAVGEGRSEQPDTADPR